MYTLKIRNKKLLLSIIVIAFLAAIALLLVPPYLEWEYKAQSLTDEKMRESFYIVRDACLMSDWMGQLDILYASYNSTHVIDNNTCEWNEMTESDFKFYQLLSCPDYRPPSPQKGALWNGEKCWWYLEDPKIPFEHLKFQYTLSPSDDSLGHYEEWCEDNNGLWFPRNNDCKYLTEEAGEKAKTDLESRETIKVSGSVAQRICEIINFSCPENPEFDGSYNLSSGKTHVNLYNQGTQFTFRLIDDTFSYKISTESKSGEWIEDIRK